MTTVKRKKTRVVILSALGCFLGAHLLFYLLPNIFETWNLKAVDQLFIIRTAFPALNPTYDGAVVHLDLNRTSIRKLDNFYTSRFEHAQVIRNLHAMGAAALLYDFIFAARTDKKEDAALIEATRNAGNVIYGVAFRLLGGAGRADGDKGPDDSAYLSQTAWKVTLSGSAAGFYSGADPLETFPALAGSSKGLGFVNLPIDRDGVYRRLPLLIRYKQAFYPGIAFRLVCGYLGVSPDRIVVTPGRSVMLKGARRPGTNISEDIVIPIDAQGNMRINFPGDWGRITHYNFADVLLASRDREEMFLWQEELGGKIVVISEVLTGSADVGPVPTDAYFPLSGCHAAVINTILTGEFLKEFSPLNMLWIEIPLLAGMVLMAARLPAIGFAAGGAALLVGYLVFAAACFFFANLILNLVRPLAFIFSSLVVIQVAHAIENARLYAAAEKARDLAQRELEIGRKIQAGFFPETIAPPECWEIAAYFEPARQVAGDFYDVFDLDDDGRVCFLISDVCDKGVGAALFMALFRSLVRAFAARQPDGPDAPAGRAGADPEEILIAAIHRTNNYIAHTHSRANMFATGFFGILTPDSGEIRYINCGHEAPLILRAGQVRASLAPTGPAIGAFPDLAYKSARVCLEPGEVLLAFTDGVTDAQNPAGEFFTRKRLAQAAAAADTTAPRLAEKIRAAIGEHTRGAPPFDDITFLVVRREEPPGGREAWTPPGRVKSPVA